MTLNETMDIFNYKAIIVQRFVRGMLARRLAASLRKALEEKRKAEEKERKRKAKEEKERKQREKEAAKEAKRLEKEKEEREKAEQDALDQLELEAADRKEREAQEQIKREAQEKEDRARKEKEDAERKKKDAEADVAGEALTSPASGIRRKTRRGTQRPLSLVGDEPAKRRMILAPMSLKAYDKLKQNFVGEAKIPKDVEDYNRYINILPNPRSRVRLSKIGDDETSTYINANFVQSYKGLAGEYIATQGPMKSTVNAFWRMVWEHNCRAIVMVTGLVERGIDKCSRYWPKKLYNEEAQVGDKQYGDFNVAVVEGFRADGYVTSKFRVTNGDGEQREIWHFWFNSWPDHGVPENTEPVAAMLQACRSWSNQPDQPWVVHCSAGIGRTGTFIAIDHGLNHLEEAGKCDVNQIIAQIRKDRGGLVQHREQAQFTHDALVAYVAIHGDGDGGDASYAEDSDGDFSEIISVLDKSIEKAELCTPPHFVCHPSQVDTDEGAEERVPSWRKEQVGQRKEEKLHELKGQETYIAKRVMAKEDLLRVRRQAVDQLIDNDQLPDLSIATDPVNPSKTQAMRRLSDMQYAELVGSGEEEDDDDDEFGGGFESHAALPSSGATAGSSSYPSSMYVTEDFAAFVFFQPVFGFTDSVGGERGDKVEVLRNVNDEWLLVINKDGDQGLFPIKNLSKSPQGLAPKTKGSRKNSSRPSAKRSARPPRSRSSAVVVGIADYNGQAKNSLAFSEGDELELIEKLSEDWLHVKKRDGSMGIVPANHVDMTDLEEEDDVVTALEQYFVIAPYVSDSARTLSLEPGQLVTLVKVLSAEWLEVTRPDGQTGLAPANRLQKVDNTFVGGQMMEAIASYTGPDATQVSFKQTEKVLIVRDRSEAWSEVYTEDKSFGLAPRNYLKPIMMSVTMDFTAQAPNEVSVYSGEVVTFYSEEDGNSRMRVMKESGNGGVVPEYCLEFVDKDNQKSSKRASISSFKLITPGNVKKRSMRFASKPSTHGASDPKHWSNEQVMGWVKEQPPSINVYFDVFEQEAWTGRDLLAADAAALEDIGVSNSTVRYAGFGRYISLYAIFRHLNPHFLFYGIVSGVRKVITVQYCDGCGN